MMRVVLWGVLLTAIVIAAVVGIGALLPLSHTATRSVTIAQPSDTVFAAVRDVGRYPDWWDELSRVDLLPSVDGRTRFREHKSTGPIVMEIVEDTPPSRLITRIADPDQPFGGTWTFEVDRAPGGSRLTITERGEVYNPLFRFLSRFVFGHTATMESFLRALERKFGEQVEPA